MFARLFALIFFLFSPPVFAGLQLYNYGGIEFRTSGGYTQVSTASPESTRLRGGVVAEVSDVQPKVTASSNYPYKTRPGTSVSVNGTARVSPSKFGKAATNIIKGAGAAAVGASGAPFVALGTVACAFYCNDIIELLGDKVAGFVQNPDGSISPVGYPDNEDYERSTGIVYRAYRDFPGVEVYASSPESACSSIASPLASALGQTLRSHALLSPSVCFVYTTNDQWSATVTSISNCPSDDWIKKSDGKCVKDPDLKPYGDPLTDAEIAANLAHYVSNSAWPGSRAPHLAAALAPNYDILEDGSAEISGPASVPLSESRTTENVALHPGTNIPVPPGHTGPTDPGTRTSTTTSTANNTYNGNTMTTNIVNNTTTNITNKITNNTITDTKTEETDKPPEKEDKDKCEEGAKTIDCAELDTPEGEVPRDEIQITFTPDDLGFGSGSCPADRVIGADYVFSYSATCGMLHSYGRYLVWMLASITALMIIFAGRTDA